MLALGLSLAALVLIADQATKMVMLAHLDGPVEVTPFFNLVRVWNPGVSFGLFGSAGPSAAWVLSGLALAVVVGLTVWLARTSEKPIAIGLGLVIGGALGNVVDRIRFGAVFDFLDFHAFGFHWPAFNVADAAIVVGAAVLLVDGLLLERRRSK
jgi:signal peptidase II